MAAWPRGEIMGTHPGLPRSALGHHIAVADLGPLEVEAHADWPKKILQSKMFHMGIMECVDLVGGIVFWTVGNFMFQCSNWLVWIVFLDGNQHFEWGAKRVCALSLRLPIFNRKTYQGIWLLTFVCNQIWFSVLYLDVLQWLLFFPN